MFARHIGHGVGHITLHKPTVDTLSPSAYDFDIPESENLDEGMADAMAGDDPSHGDVAEQNEGDDPQEGDEDNMTYDELAEYYADL